MASGTTEIGKLMVRLMGDATHLQKTLRSASRLTQEFGRKMTKWITMPVLGFAALSVKAFADFDQAMTKSLSIMTIEGKNAAAVTQKMRDVALDLGTKGTQGPKELADSYYFLASAGLNAEQSMRALPIVQRFATAGAFDMATATDLLTDAQTSLGPVLTDVGKDMEDLGDHIVLAAKQANASVQQFSESLTSDAGVAARNYGMEIETTMAILGAYASSGKKAAEAGNLMGRATRLMTKAWQDNGKVFLKYGINMIDEQTGEFKNFIDVIAELEKSFEGLTSPQRVARLKELGFEALAQKSILPLISMSAQMKEWEEAQKSAAGTTKEVFEKQMESLTNKLKMLWNQITVMAIKIGATLEPAITSVIEKIKEWADWWTALSAGTQMMYLKIIALAAAIGPLLIVGGKLITMFNLLSAGTAAANLGLKAMAVVGLVMITKAIYESTDAVKDYNTELARMAKLTEDEKAVKDKLLGDRDAAIDGPVDTGKVDAEGKAIYREKTAAEKVKALEAELKIATRDVQTAKAMTKEAEKVQQDYLQDSGGRGPAVLAYREFKEMAAGLFGSGSKGQLLEDETGAAKNTWNEAAARKMELEKRLEAEKAQVKVQSDLAAVESSEKLDNFKKTLPKMADAAKKMFGPYGLIGGGMASGMRTLKKKAAPALATAKDSLGAIGKAIVDRGAEAPYRANMASMGGTAADYSGREFTSKFLQENRKEKKENWDAKQYDQLTVIADVVKKNLRPYGGIQDLFEIVRG